MIIGNDGGVDLSLDGGENWFAPPLPWSQFYNVDADDRVPYHVGGTVQDEGTATGPSDSRRAEGIVLGDWKTAGGGEAGDFVFDRAQEGVVYAGEYGGIMTRWDEKSGNERNISYYPTNPSGHGADDLRVRFQWTAPLLASRREPGVIYHGSNILLRSADGGQTWKQVSPDLTRNDKEKQQWSGGPITGDNTGVEIYDTIFSLAESSARRRRALGRDRRRPGARDAGRRRELDERDPGRDAGVGDGRVDRPLPCRRRHRLDRRRCPSARRPPPLSLPHPGRRADLGSRRSGTAAQRLRPRGARGSGSSRACSTPGRASASSCRATAAIAGRRSSSTCRRSWSPTSRSRRPIWSSRPAGARSGSSTISPPSAPGAPRTPPSRCTSSRPARRGAYQLPQRVERRGGGGESAARRGRPLLAGEQGGGRGDPRDLRRRRAPGAQALEHRQAAALPGGRSGRADEGAGGRALRRGGPPSRGLGSALGGCRSGSRTPRSTSAIRPSGRWRFRAPTGCGSPRTGGRKRPRSPCCPTCARG